MSTVKSKEKLAKILRMITVPPILVTLLIFALYRCTNTIITNPRDMLVMLLGLGIFPVLAYPSQKLIPAACKEDERRSQRKLAFIFSLVGYTFVFLYGIFTNVNHSLQIIFRTYFFSVVLLTVFNKLLKLRASGHACSSIAPAAILSYYSNLISGIPFVMLFALSVWASLYLKRHKPLDIFLGSVTFIISFLLSIVIDQ